MLLNANVKTFTHKLATVLCNYAINNFSLSKCSTMCDLEVTFDPTVAFNLIGKGTPKDLPT